MPKLCFRRESVSAPFSWPRNDARPAAQPTDAADHRRVLAEQAVARKRRELGRQAADVVEGMRPVDVARHLRFLPRREPAVGLVEQRFELALQAADLLGDVQVGGAAEMAELGDLAFEIGDRLLEVEKGPHG